MRHRFAVGTRGRLTEIGRVAATGRRALGPFACPGCGGAMVPVLGEVREHHFRHLRAECARETYLHALGKRVFLHGFRQAIEENRPYPILFGVPGVCREHETLVGAPCEVGCLDRRIDLARHFDRVSLEAPIGGFIADALLEGPFSRHLLVELRVTHACDSRKLESGLRIVEIGLRDEEDALALARGLDARGSNARLHNFRPMAPRELAECLGRACPTRRRLRIEYRSGRTFHAQGQVPALVAAKYGALSGAEGHVSVTWRRAEGPGGEQLHLDWTETAGPRVEKPSRRGFGTLLVERLATNDLHGEASIDYDPTGLRCTLMLPWSANIGPKPSNKAET